MVVHDLYPGKHCSVESSVCAQLLNTGVSCHVLLQGIFPTKELKQCLVFPALAGRFFTIVKKLLIYSKKIQLEIKRSVATNFSPTNNHLIYFIYLYTSSQKMGLVAITNVNNYQLTFKENPVSVTTTTTTTTTTSVSFEKSVVK